MASSGRGRGRGRGLLANVPSDDGSVRPGPRAEEENKVMPNGDVDKTGSSKKTNSVAEIRDLLENVSLNLKDEDTNMIFKVVESPTVIDKEVTDMANMVYNKCTCDREYAKTGAFLCDKLASLDVNGSKFRSTLLSLVQADYKDKDTIRGKSTSTFCNTFSFMCQIFGTMRTMGGEVFKPLIGPIFEYIDMIMDNKEYNHDEFECLNEQLQSIGKDLEQNDREKMDQLLEKIRSKIIRSGSTAQVRCLLLEVLECSARGWKELPNDVTRFYCDTMMDLITDFEAPGS